MAEQENTLPDGVREVMKHVTNVARGTTELALLHGQEIVQIFKGERQHHAAITVPLSDIVAKA